MEENCTQERQEPPSILEELLRKSQQFVEGAIADRIKATVDRALDWTFRRVINYLCAAALFATAAVFALVAGTEGLKHAGVPPWVAYLVLACVGLVGGCLLLRRPGTPTR